MAARCSARVGGAVRGLRRSRDRHATVPLADQLIDERRGDTTGSNDEIRGSRLGRGAQDDRRGRRRRRARDHRARAAARGDGASRPPAAEDRAGAREGVLRDARRGDEGRPDAVGRRPRAGPRGDPPRVPGDPRPAPARRRAGLVQGDPRRRSRTTSARSSPTSSRTSPRSRSPPRRSARSTARRSSDGRDVAVKVQYPGIAEAIHADLQNLRLGLKLLSVDRARASTPARSPTRSASASARSSTTSSRRPTTARWRARTAATRSSSCPTSSRRCARERVLVSEYVDGARFTDGARRCRRPSATALGEILVRFYLNGPLRHRLLNGDPHPGNALFLADGRVAFLDFGFFKHLSNADVEQLVATTQATYEGDAAAPARRRRRARLAAARPGARRAVPRELPGDLRLAARRPPDDGRRVEHRRDDAPLQPAARGRRLRRR